MSTLAFQLTTENFSSRRGQFRGANNLDYYDGEIGVLSSPIDQRIDKTLAGECTIYRLVSRGGLSFRRTWSHVRSDQTDVVVFWFVRSGEVMISHQGGRYIVEPHQCAITRSHKAFYMEHTPPPGGVLDVLHVMAPAHMVQSLVDADHEMGKPFPTSKGSLKLIESAFDLLMDDGDDADVEIVEQLTANLLIGLTKTIARLSGAPPPRSSVSDKRMADIRNYISQNLANSSLDAAMVARGCGISPRYLSHLLSKNQSSLLDLVWDRRLTTAQGWLKDVRMKQYSIAEIAYLVGFKSSSHFSRTFKARFLVTPRELREHYAGSQDETSIGVGNPEFCA